MVLFYSILSHHVKKKKKNKKKKKKPLIAYAASIGSGDTARILARTYAVRSRKRPAKEKPQPRKETCSLAKGPGMPTTRLI